MPADLHREVDKLKEWLNTNSNVDQYASWWTEQGIVGAVQRFLAGAQAEDWTEAEVTDLLFVLEHSSTGYISELVTQDAMMALSIAKLSLARGGVASDDIAEQLGNCNQHREAAEALLLEFARSEHERTRRMALLSLAQLQSATVPALAVSAWNTGDEYQRIGALAALRTIASDLLATYLSEAQQDGRPNLVAFARKCAADLARWG